jgi:putative Mg2+ transporter-C (MgtC) family protein
MQMPLSPTWTDIAVRLALTMLAGALLGFYRGARGHAAGLRTIILVSLAASAATISATSSCRSTASSPAPLPSWT